MITFINESGAVHTTEKELYNSTYKHCRKITKAQLAKLGKLATDVSELADTRLNAVDADGKPDNEARTNAAKEMQKAKAAEEAYRKELLGDDE